MKQLLFILLFYTVEIAGFSQSSFLNISYKPPLDTLSFFNWPDIDQYNVVISNDGKYVLYSTRISANPARSKMLTIQTLSGDKTINLNGVLKAEFTEDSHYLTFIQSGDSLCLLTLANGNRELIGNVKSFQLFMRDGVQYLVYLINNSERELIVQNLATGVQVIYKNVSGYILSESGRMMALKSAADSKGGGKVTLRLVNLITKEVKSIWVGNTVTNLVFGHNESLLAFLEQNSNSDRRELWLYKNEEINPVSVLKSDTELEGMEVSNIVTFSKDDSRLFVNLSKKKPASLNPFSVKVNIWSYTDSKLQSQQIKELPIPKNYFAVLFLENPVKMLRLQEDEKMTFYGKKFNDDKYLLFESRKGETSESYWNKESIGTSWLVSSIDAKRSNVNLSDAAFSPAKKYIIGNKDSDISRDLYIYEVATGFTRNITANLPIPKFSEILDWARKSRGLERGAWLENDEAFILNDDYDLWLIDPLSREKPIKLTNGRTLNWQFRLAENYLTTGRAIKKNETILLTAFNRGTKESGFYELNLTTKKLTKLFTGQYRFTLLRDAKDYLLRSRDSDVYLLLRERANESPNIFATKDFKSFVPVTNLYPEKKFNWYTSHLISFKTVDGENIQALLYKPENLDSTKKYPLIIHYYEQNSDELNQFRRPIPSNGGGVDIPWFTSHGYLVCVTDIRYKIGKPGESAKKAVEGAALYLISKQQVDKDHIGIQGNSFGAYETNYIVTHSNLFAAAISSSGMSNLISFGGNIWSNGMYKLEYLEMRGGRLATTPWDNPSVYVDNSPIFNIGKVNTPILMVNNPNDQYVQFEQGLQFFTALRRTGKRAWMLSYDNESHGLLGEDYKDYLMRSSQFFDHYLKDSACPKWMLYGVPAVMKGTEDGFDLCREIDHKTNRWVTPQKGGLLTSEAVINVQKKKRLK